MFLAKPHHSQFALLSFFASQDLPAKEFLSKEFRIEELYSVLFSLHQPYWNATREDIMKAVSNICDRLLNFKANMPFNANEYDRVLEDLSIYLNPHAQFLSAAKQVLLEKQLEVRL
jgi:hypothetical protein